MRTTRDGFLVSFIAAGVLAAGCGGGQTGDLGGHNDNEGTLGGGNCTEQEQPLDVDTPTDLGFSAGKLLEWLEGSREASLAWGTSEMIDFTPSGATTNATFALECASPNARFVDSAPKPRSDEGGLLGGEEGAFGDACPDRVRVDCELTVTTEDGGFDESYEVTVEASAPDLARINHALQPDEFAGNFEIGEPHAANTEVKQLTLGMAISRFGVAGSLASVIETRLDGAVGAGWVTYAHWPSETCEGVSSEAFVVDENSDAGEASGAAIVERLAPDDDREVDWDDGEQAALSLTIDPESRGCVEFSPYEPGMIAYYSASVDASSDDGRLEFSGTGDLRAHYDGDGELMYATIQVSAAPSMDDVALLMGTSVEEAEQLAAEYDQLELSFAQTFDMDASQGFIRLLGATIPECISNPTPPEPMETPEGGGAPGCEGIDQQVVFEGTWTP